MHVPIDQPHYGIGPAGMVRFVRKYATFRGRASRSEFWWGQLTMLLAGLVLVGPGAVVSLVLFSAGMERYTASAATTPAAPFAAAVDAGPGLLLLAIGSLGMLGLTIPSLALVWRRLQDAGLHGAWAFASLLLGSVAWGIVALVPGMLPSSARGARYERSPQPVLPPGVEAAAWTHERRMAEATPR